MGPDDSDDVPYSVVGIVFEPVRAEDEHISPVDAAEDSTDFIASVLSRQGLVAGLLDGALLGAPGWVLVQTLEFDNGSIARWTIPGSAAGQFERVGVYELRMALEAETGRRVQIGTTLTLPNGVFEEGNFGGTSPDWWKPRPQLGVGPPVTDP
ncbi:MAG TPA: hypothetical protein VFM62_01065 [Arthrobacter sp.]|nr:hypothetical protein [Arthrobacter sp.]